MSVVHGTNNAIKKNILSTLGNIKRIGMNALVGWLEATDYFCAPCSRDHHLNTIGGLARHSFNMYWCLIDYVTKYSIEVDADSIAICSLLHDVCKIGRYERGTKRQECNGKWSTVECWVTTNDLFPIKIIPS